MIQIRGLKFTYKGGKGSGHHGHTGGEGGKGKPGGSTAGTGTSAQGSSSPTKKPIKSPIKSTTPLSEEQRGVNNTYLIECKDGSRGIFKPASETEYGDPKAEVLAYELSKSLGWDIVPHTEMITHQGKEGSTQEWVENSKTFQELGLGGTGKPREVYEEANTRIHVFDLLTGNPDRHYGNAIRDGKMTHWAIDNGECFGPTKAGDPKRFFLYSGQPFPRNVQNSSARKELANWKSSAKMKDFTKKLAKTLGPRVRDDFITNINLLTRNLP